MTNVNRLTGKPVLDLTALPSGRWCDLKLQLALRDRLLLERFSSHAYLHEECALLLPVFSTEGVDAAVVIN